MYSNSPAKSYGYLTATTQIVSRPCILLGFQLTAGSATTTLSVYDSIAGTTNASMLDQHVLAANSNSANQWFGPQGIYCGSGIYAALSGTGASFMLYYSLV
jgi:hypothetical protein